MGGYYQDGVGHDELCGMECLGLCPVIGFGISDVESWSFFTRELILYQLNRKEGLSQN
jgi:hypothetical protein